ARPRTLGTGTPVRSSARYTTASFVTLISVPVNEPPASIRRTPLIRSPAGWVTSTKYASRDPPLELSSACVNWPPRVFSTQDLTPSSKPIASISYQTSAPLHPSGGGSRARSHLLQTRAAYFD